MGAAARAAQQVAPEVEEAVAGALEAAGQFCGTLPGIGPDTINVIAEASPALDVAVPDLATAGSLVPEMDAGMAAAQWFVQTVSRYLNPA